MDLPDNFILDIEEKLTAMRDIRIDAGYTQGQLAELLGIDQSRIARWEAGEWRKSKHMQTFIQMVRMIDNLQQEIANRQEAEDTE